MEKNRVSASELKTHCSKIIDGVARKRDVVEVTRHGKIVARIVPVDEAKPESLFGFARGCVSIYGDILEPVDPNWEAAEP